MRPHRRLVALGASVVVTAALSQVIPGTGTASGAPPTPTATASGSDHQVNPRLGNGLGRLLQEEQGKSRRGAGGLQVDQGSLAIRDSAGRVLIHLTPAKGADRAAFRRAAADLGFEVTSADAKTGTLEGFAELADVDALAGLRDLGTISQALKPFTRAGATTSQGVEFQKVDQVLARGIDGEGITIGVLSDSYDTATEAVTGGPILTHADDDIASGDLPGPGNPEGNTTPIVVIEDYPGADSTDEGRGMLQIVHDVAPKAKLCFATAFSGDVGFANNIRALADRDGPCRADVIVDDVGYFNEPFFSDGVISAAVDDVKAAGVSYFSSAGNAGDQNAWRAPVDLTAPAGVPAAAAAAGLDFTGVDPALYAGGVQDMNPGAGSDIGQTLQIAPGGGLWDIQWNDPVDADGPEISDPVFEDSGTLTAGNSEAGVDFTFTAPADLVGETVLFRTDGVPSGTVDLIIDVTTPGGDHLGPVDTGASPEVIPYTIEQAGDHTITVSGYQGATGDFTVDVSVIESPSNTTTDFNALFFDEGGTYLGAIGDDNTLTGQPNEVFALNFSNSATTELQMVLAKATPGATPVSEIAYINNGGVYTEEYFNPVAPATFGHPTAAGANGVAAIDPFKPYVSEYYTSPGGALKFYFNRYGQRLRNPQTRMKPDIASTDRGNTTFFVADDLRDDDDFPNFGGTSAAAPHAAAIAALMLDGAGGPGSLTPDEVKQTMKDTAFQHDLDPFRATGAAGGLRVTAVGHPGDERDATPASMDDPNFFRVTYNGNVPIKSLSFFGYTASPTALGATPTDPSAGLVFDPRPLADPEEFRTGGFPFTVGNTSAGVPPSSIGAEVMNRVGSTPFYRVLKVKFFRGLKKGQMVRFGIDRDIRYPGLAPEPVEGNGADEIGGGVFIPQDAAQPRGMRFVATLANGRRITGYVYNNLGNGFSPVDGYGVVNADAAVSAFED
jgi:hypothetical protein